MQLNENIIKHSTLDVAQMDQLLITPMDLYAFQQNHQQEQLKQQQQQQQQALLLHLHGQQHEQQQQLQQQQYQNSSVPTSMMPTSSSSSTMSSSSSLSSFPSIYDTQLQLHQHQQQQHHHNIQNHFLSEHSMASLSSLAVSYATTATTPSTTNTTQSSPSPLIQLANSYQQFQEQQQQQQQQQKQHNVHHQHNQQQQQQQHHQQQQHQNKNFYNLHNHQTDSHQQLQNRQQQHQQQQQQLHLQQHQQQYHHNMPITTNTTIIDSTSTTVTSAAATLTSAPPPTSTTITTTKKYLNSDTSSMTSTTANADANSSAVTFTTTTTAAGTSGAKNLLQQQQQQQQGSSASPYKSCWCFGDSTFHMKILVPAVASGAIIGKGGETIATLQKDTGARVKMSKSHDFYPGTTERVCLITGTVEGIMTVLDFIMDKIREKPDLTTKLIDTEAKQTQDRDKQVKILVPNSTAGMIIGKGGAFIKQIKEESGSYVQISQKPKDISLQERCITIIGDKENNKNACKMILSKIVEDPQSGTCLNVSYADVNGPVANFNPTGSPYATNQNAINSSTASLNSTLGTTISSAAAAASLLVNGTGINLSLNLGSPNPTPNLAVATQLLEHIKVAMRGSGYSESATTEVCAALGVLAKYGVLGIGVGVPHANGAHTTLGSYLGVSALEQQTAATAASATGNVFGAVGQVNLEQYAAAAAAAAAASRPSQSQLEAAAAAQFDAFRHLGTAAAAQATTPVSLNNNSFGLTAGSGTSTTAQTLGAAAAAHSLTSLSKSPTPGDLGAKDSKNVEIPEVIVGAILGPSGRSLVEIQHVSGANVQISKKGIFAPGTRNRIVTITGQPSAIAKAQFLIEQKINEEETKRARQIPLTTVVN